MNPPQTTQLFLNREIGWLKFNKRVLFQAKDERNPLLERLKFLNIFHSNLDEFFMKRVGGLQRQFYARVSTLSPDGLTPEDQLKMIRPRVLELNEDIRQLLRDDLLPQLTANNIFLVEWQDLSQKEKDWATAFFRDRIFSVLTPMAVDPGHPFPLISSLSTSLAASRFKCRAKKTCFLPALKCPVFFRAGFEFLIPNPV